MQTRSRAGDVGGLAVAAVVAICGWACTSTTTESSPQTAVDAGADAAPSDDAGGGGAPSDDAGGGGAPSDEAGGGGAPSDGGAPGGLTGGPVDLGAVFNARQTGGLTTESGQTVRANVLIRSGQIITPDACASLESLGVQTVIDLRAASAVAMDPDTDCVSTTASYTNADLPKILPPGEDTYLQTLDAMEPKLNEIFARLSGDGALPAIIHCVIGRDRASLMMALVLLSLGVPENQVLDDFENNQETDTDRAWMSGVLQRIDQAGGIDAYLAQHGVTAAQLESLRAAALE